MINYLDIQEAIWNAVSSINKYKVVDYIEFDKIEPPFIRLGNLYFDDNSVKNGESVKAQQYINIYSTYSGKREILEMMDEVNRSMVNIKNVDIAHIDNDMNMTIERHDVHVKKGHISINLAKDQLGSIHLRMDKNNNKFYHAVKVFAIHLYMEGLI